MSESVKTALIDLLKPFKLSVQKIQMLLTPRFLRSLKMFNQYSEDSLSPI